MNISKEEKIFKAACAWSKLNFILDENLKTHPDLIVTAPVCKSFLCELLLKALISSENHDFGKQHSLENLFLQLNGKTQNLIKTETIKHLKEIGIEITNEQFSINLKLNGNTFENWRYYYEDNQFVNMDFINSLYKALANYSNSKFN